MRRLAAVPLLALLVVSACGGDDGDSSETTAAATTEGATEETAASPSTVDVTDAPDDTTSDSAAPDDTTGSTAEGEVGEDEAAYVDALMEDYDGDDPDVARCLGEAVVNGIGLQQLQDAGITTQQFADASGTQELGVEFEDSAVVEEAIVGCGDGYLVLTLAEVEDTPENRACADDNAIDDALVARVLVATFAGDAPSAEDEATFTAFQTCIEGGEG